jgi:hypothetical protein
LDDEQFEEVVDAMAEKKVGRLKILIYSGEEIIIQGGIGDYFYGFK